MRVLMIGLTEFEGGSQRHILELSRRIGCDILTQRTKLKSAFMINALFALEVYWWALWHLMIGKRKYDIIHIHENLLYGLASLLRFRYKVIITVHGLKGFKFYDNILLWLFFSLGLHAAGRIIAVSLGDRKRLAKYGLKSVYIPNGVDLSAYGHITPKVEKKIMFIGRIHEQKGLIYLLEAFSRLNLPNWGLEIIGDAGGDYALRLQEKYSRNIIWRGSIKDRKEIVRSLKSAYMIALPSVWEGLPLTLFESLASGRPVILSDIPAFRSVVNNESLFFSSKNVNDLKDKIEMVIKMGPFWAKTIGMRGRRLAEKYDWNAIAKQTDGVYEET